MHARPAELEIMLLATCVVCKGLRVGTTIVQGLYNFTPHEISPGLSCGSKTWYTPAGACLPTFFHSGGAMYY